jgi:hypothetical protein
MSFAKALVPTIVGAILLILAQVGITEGMTVSELITFVVTSAIVYFVPNKPVEV